MIEYICAEEYQRVSSTCLPQEPLCWMALNKSETLLFLGSSITISIWAISQKINPKQKQMIELPARGETQIVCFCNKNSNWFVCSNNNSLHFFKEENEIWKIEQTINQSNTKQIKINNSQNELIWCGENTINVVQLNDDHWNWSYGLNQYQIQDICYSLDDTELASVDSLKVTIWRKDQIWRKKQNINIEKRMITKVGYLGQRSLIVTCFSGDHQILRLEKSISSGIYVICQIINFEATLDLIKFLNPFNIQVFKDRISLNMFKGNLLLFYEDPDGNLKLIKHNISQNLQGIFTNDGQYFFGRSLDRVLMILKK